MANHLPLERAYELAYFLHRDAEVARRIAVDAAGMLEVTATAQSKRLYYAAASRTKVALGDLHLLQRLVYVASERYEVASERDAPERLTERDLVARFVKHLVRITVKRSSFYATLGVARLLHAYSTPETAELYAVVVQDPDRVGDEAYFRARKKVLMHEMTKRFGGLLRTTKGQRGEERFEHAEATDDTTGFARACLERFTLWDTACRVPREFAPLRDPLPALARTGRDADAEPEVEVNRLHAVLHPACFERLALALALEAPARRIEVPRFHLAASANDDTDDRTPPRLGDDDLSAMTSTLAAHGARRKSLSAGALAVLVDGDLRATLAAEAPRIAVDVPEGAEIVEVRDRAGDVPVAALVLERDASGDHLRASRVAVRLEGGQRVLFDVVPNGAGGGHVEVAYREAFSLGALGRRLAAPGRAWTLAKPALAFGLLAVVAAGAYTLWSRSASPPPAAPVADAPRAAEPTAPTPVAPEKAPDEVAGAGSASPGRHGSASPGRHGSASPGRSRDAEDATRPNVTRGQDDEWTAVQLRDVKSIYVDPLGESAEAAGVREALVDALRQSGRFAPAADRDAADAVMKGSVTTGTGGARVALRLVNADGEVIWSGGAKTASQAVTALVDAAKQ